MNSILEHLNSHTVTEEENRLATRIIGASVHALLRNNDTGQDYYSELFKLLQYFEKTESLTASQVKNALEQTNRTLAQYATTASAKPLAKEPTTEATGHLVSIISAAYWLLQTDYTDMDIRKAKTESLSSTDAYRVAETLNHIALKLQTTS